MTRPPAVIENQSSKAILPRMSGELYSARLRVAE
jgi:hypothetical protein